jgi:hypothetical protein
VRVAEHDSSGFIACVCFKFKCCFLLLSNRFRTQGVHISHFDGYNHYLRPREVSAMKVLKYGTVRRTASPGLRNVQLRCSMADEKALLVGRALS